VEGHAPVDPFTDQAEWPILGHITDVKSARNSAPGKLRKGAIEYSVIFTIRGGGNDDLAIPGEAPNSTLLLTNQ
jgi:hypothetical protein